MASSSRSSRDVKPFELKVTGSEDAGDAPAAARAVLERFQVEYELRTTSNEELCLRREGALEVETETVTNAILMLDTEGKLAVDWDDKKPRRHEQERRREADHPARRRPDAAR